jgi:hypothetical protein
MPALNLSKHDPELQRGESAAYNLCRVLHEASAANTWTVIPYRDFDYIVSVRIEHRGTPVGGPPLIEMATGAQLRAAQRWSREVARHLRRVQAAATFWGFPGQMGRARAAYVVQVEAVITGAGRDGHTALIPMLRHMAAATQPRRKAPRRKSKRRRKSP